MTLVLKVLQGGVGDQLDVNILGNIGGRVQTEVVDLVPGGGDSTTIDATIETSAFAPPDPGTNHSIFLVDTTGGAFTVTLPASPTTNAKYTFIDTGGAVGTNPLTLGRNGNLMLGLASDLLFKADNGAITIIFDGSSWWRY